MEENEEIKSCSNCRYFVQFYIKNRTHIMKISSGRCKNERVKAKDKPKIVNLDCCDKWEPYAIEKEEQRQLIKIALRDMAKHLKEIATILKDEEE